MRKHWLIGARFTASGCAGLVVADWHRPVVQHWCLGLGQTERNVTSNQGYADTQPLHRSKFDAALQPLPA